ncbi:respiratory nitrate reductase subunit gamma [Prolixibacter denitrificans]|uniref:nitrate reductase (quinone) n=1 Tax=Prolixibacter denitrificans TaxID=1541063 RepID=A0A2P8CCT0_9BACT|nr:respiratory nitrate reductase subunit gamma [Prolixibacter denitrificans]PSK82777.1 nitrate reductase gamma subunit [Prolixibacter denitrificans]GET21406.1 nitrate reductase subunit gamma [Prolixibacter denitrificans]
MENYINNFLFTYLPHIAMAVFWFGLITRIVKTSRTIQAKSSQFLAGDGLKWGSNLFHYGIILVFIGHFTGLFTPEKLYHLVMTTATKRILAVSLGAVFGTLTFIGIIILIIRRFRNERIKLNSSPQDYFIIFLLLVEVGLGLASMATTATSSVENYAALGEWAQKIITFQPDAGAVIAGHSLIYKLHIVTGLFIFIIFPYTKLMHIMVLPIAYFFRSGYQLVRRR